MPKRPHLPRLGFAGSTQLHTPRLGLFASGRKQSMADNCLPDIS
jgi:hypothetical protein